MNDTALARLIAAIRAKLTNLVHSETGAAVFAQVRDLGETVDETALPLALLSFGEQRTPLETTHKTHCTLPLRIWIEFEQDPRPPVGTQPAVDAGSIRTRAADLVGEVQKVFADDPNVDAGEGETAHHARYAGGGSEILPLDEDEQCRRWGVLIQFEFEYKFQTNDPTIRR